MQDTFNKLVQTTIAKLHPILVIDEDYWDTPIIHIWSQIQHKAYLCTNQLNLIISNIQASSIIIAKLKNNVSDPQWLKPAPTVISYTPTKLKTIIKVSCPNRLHTFESELLFNQLNEENEAIVFAEAETRTLTTSITMIYNLLQELPSVNGEGGGDS